LQGALLIVDDRAARSEAQRLQVRITGTFGVIVKAKQAGFLTQARPLIEALDQLGFHLDSATRNAVLRMAGELT
jgi:predicted nucleic acid-binding protein